MNFYSLFKRKFSVRVMYFSEGKYAIEYAYYRLIPIYSNLCFWYCMSYTSGTESWSPRLLNYQDACNLAKTFKTIDDVYKWYRIEEEKEREFYINKKEYFAKNAPYRTKYFN